MAKFTGEVLGRILTLLGWDGTVFRNVKVDEAGHLQIDALTVPLITGYASEVTLTAVRTCLGELVSPGSGSVNEQLGELVRRIGNTSTPEAGSANQQLAYIYSCVDLLDKLTKALKTFDTDTLQVDVVTSGLPTGAATGGKQDSLYALTLPQTQSSPAGGFHKLAVGNPQLATGAFRLALTHTVTASKVDHVVMVSITCQGGAIPYSIRLYEGAARRFEWFTSGYTFTVPFGWYLSQTAGNVWSLEIYQNSGGSVWFMVTVVYLEVPA